MERLTNPSPDGSYDAFDPIDIVGNEYSKINYKNLLAKLGEYEDAEEQGLLPRFHLGDEFWIEWLGEVLKAKIVMLQQKKNGTWKYRFCDEHSNTMDYEEREYEKNFWFTKEQAEQALAELKGGGNNG